MVITTISYEYHWRLEEAFDVSFEESLNWVYGENIKFHKTEKDQRHTTELDSMLFRFGLVRSIVKSSIDCGKLIFLRPFRIVFTVIQYLKRI